jgi:4-hydroxybenzoyl-CoA reductase subunit beta
MYVAGGTDLLPNLKNRLYDLEHLISLRGVSRSGIVAGDDGSLEIAAGTTMATLATDPTILASVPALAEAAVAVAGPLHRNRATLGGNVMLDTRCLFYNQTADWRKALGHCLKREGVHCHVLNSPRSCVAAMSGDTVPVLAVLGAELVFETADGPVTLAAGDLHGKDGRRDQNHQIAAGALLTRVRIPAARPLSVFRKVRPRMAIDFSQLSVAVALTASEGRLTSIDVAYGAIQPRPIVLRKLEEFVGGGLGDATVDALAEAAVKQVRPQVSIAGDQGWRREMSGVELARALRALRGRAGLG